MTEHPLRIALAHPYPWPEVRRGAERYLDDLAWYLAGQGHDVTVITGTDGPSRADRRPDGALVEYRHRVLAVRGARFGLGAVETFGLAALPVLRRGRFDVVHALTPTAALAGRLSGAPTLYSVLGHPHREQRPPDPVQRWLFDTAVRRATATAVLSRASADEIADQFHRQALVLPPGVRLERFPPALTARPGPPRILFSASLADRRQRPDLAVAAFALLLDEFPDARLVLSGAGDPEWALPSGPEAARLRDAIDVVGPGDPDEVPARYRAATLTVLPAEHEAFGLALVESLACGTPAVCTPQGGMPEILDDPAVGRVAAAATPEALAEAMRQVLAMTGDPGLPGRCVEQARRFSWEDSVGPAHEAQYRALCRR